MARFVSLALVALCVVATSLVAPTAAVENVITLTSSNFDDEVKKHDFIVVEFYAPWCGHCKQLAPEYEKAATALAAEGSPIKLAKVDCDAAANKPLAQRFSVQGFPTIKIFRGGDLENPQDYKGPRDGPGIVSFVKKQGGPASDEISSADDVKKLLEDESAVVVGVFAELKGEAFEAFSRVADKLRTEFVFRHTTDAGMLPAEHPKLEGVPAVRVLTTFDEGFSDTTSFEDAELATFVGAVSVPTVVEFSQDPKDRAFLQRVFDSPLRKCLLFFPYDLGLAEEFRNKYRAVAKEHSGKMHFLIGETKANDHALKYFGIDAKETPAVIVHDPEINAKFFRTAIDPEAVAEFVADVLSGKEQKKVKSEPAPEKNDGPVKVLVGKNFDDLVTNSGKNVLIEFYAPWCGHCKKLDPIYKQVGAEFKGNPEIVIAKMDATANDVPSDKFEVKGFPTLYFYTAKGEVISYSGDRSKKDLIDFVKKQLSAAAGNDSSEAAEAAEAAAVDAEGEEEADAKDEL